MRLAGCERAIVLAREDATEDPREVTWAIGEAEAFGILWAAEHGSFPLPPETRSWQDGFREILQCLWRSPHPSLTPSIARAYPKVNGALRRCALLALLGIIGTREAAEVFMACVRTHGWPEHAYIRVFEELQSLLAFGDIMLPDVLLTADARSAPYVGDALVGAMARGLLNLDEVGDRVESLAPYVTESLKKLLKSTARMQKKPGMAWRFYERYEEPRSRTALFLDLAGRLRDPKLTPLLLEAVAFTDPRLVTFAALALLRRGENVDSAAVEKAAASHETRGILFEGLRDLERVDAFPARWRTWEAFGAAAMVEWLMYPAELGREPDELKLEHVEWSDDSHREATYVWKFRVNGDPWRAGVSGPHTLQGEPEPVAGEMTFSRFDDWAGATPEEHLERCVSAVRQIMNGNNDQQ